jgi:hypothetical protein
MPGEVPYGEKLMRLLTSKEHIHGTVHHMDVTTLLFVLEVANEEGEVQFIADVLAPELAKRLQQTEKKLDDLQQKGDAS